MGLTRPETFLSGFTVVNRPGLIAYLKRKNLMSFLEVFDDAIKNGVNEGEALCSFYAKLCYASLVLGDNLNVTQVRDIPDNVKNALSQGHGSVFEHATVNFVTTDCSRVFTHELVRHRAGTAFSQTSGRYVRAEHIDMVWDPVLTPVEAISRQEIASMKRVYQMKCDLMGLNGRKGIERALTRDESYVSHDDPRQINILKVVPTKEIIEEYIKSQLLPGTDPDKLTFAYKKKVTNALRYFLPNGIANEIGWSANLRTMRHIIQLRTSRHAAWEIRLVMNQVFDIMREKYPLMFHDAKVRDWEGLPEVYGMKTQPYEEEK